MLQYVPQIIIFYMIISFFLVLFNFIYILNDRRNVVRIERCQKQLRKEVQHQIEKIKQGEKEEQRHIVYLEKKLCSLSWLMAYEHILAELFQKDEKSARNYLSQNKEVFIQLAMVYGKKEMVEQGYYAKFIADYKIGSLEGMNHLLEILISYIPKGTIYCRENVLCALYASGNVKAVLRAYLKMEEGEVFHHNKLIADGLLTFQGDKEQLAKELWEQREHFSLEMRLGIFQYIRMVSGNFRKEFYEELLHKKLELEEKIALLRYFRVHWYTPIYPILKSYLTAEGESEWQISVVCATILEKYPTRGTIELLKQALHHKNWYIRKNAAMALIHLNVGYEELEEIINGSDRYAREILLYNLEKQEKGDNR